jgi:hypothetical protein
MDGAVDIGWKYRQVINAPVYQSLIDWPQRQTPASF